MHTEEEVEGLWQAPMVGLSDPFERSFQHQLVNREDDIIAPFALVEVLDESGAPTTIYLTFAIDDPQLFERAAALVEASQSSAVYSVLLLFEFSTNDAT